MFFKYLLFRYNLFKYNQEYVLPYFKKMNIMEKKNFINQINMVPWEKCLKALEDKNVLKNPLPIECEDINNFSIDDRRELEKIGEDNIFAPDAIEASACIAVIIPPAQTDACFEISSIAL